MMTPELHILVEIADHFEKFLAESGCPLTMDQRAAVATLREHVNNPFGQSA